MKPAAEGHAATLNDFRAYLHLIARLQIDAGLQGKVSADDIVQETMVKALQSLIEFHGQTKAEMAAWLRCILGRTLANTIRDLGRDKRDYHRECSLEEACERSSARIGNWLAAEQSSPSGRAAANEQAVMLARALEDLPEAQREALILHHLQSLTLEEVGQRLGRSTSAVAGLIKRGLRQLRQQLREQ